MNGRPNPLELGTADDRGLPPASVVASWGEPEPSAPGPDRLAGAGGSMGAAPSWDTDAGGLGWGTSGCPPWQAAIIRLVRPLGVMLMFVMLTAAALLFAAIEGLAPGVGTRMAGAMAGYFAAIPEIYYVTLAVMYGAYTVARTVQAVRTPPAPEPRP